MEAVIAGSLLLIMGLAKLIIFITRGEWNEVSEVLRKELEDDEEK